MATAGLSDAQKVANLTPEQLKRLLALVQGNAGTSNNSADFGQWTGTGDLAGYTVDRRRDVTGTSPNGPDTFSDPRTRIYQSTGSSKWKTDGETANVWDDQGNYIGPSSGDSTELGLAKFIAASVGGYYGAGAINGAGAAAGGAAGGGTGAAAGAAGGETLAGMSAVDSLAAGGGFATGEGATMVGGSALTSGAGNTVLGTTLADAGLMEAAAYGTGGLGAFDAAAATTGVTQAAQTAAEKLAAEEAAKKALGNGLDAKTLIDAAKVGTGIAGLAVAADAADTKTDDAKFNQMFDAMFADYQKMSARGDDMWNNYLTTFRPLEQKFAETAAGFDTPTRRETAANDATGQVASEYDQQRQISERNMLAAGVDPSTMYALDQSSRIVQAKDQAQAANKARSDTELQGLSLVKSAADFGRGISTGATQLQQVGQTGANAATNNATGLANVQTQNTNSRNALYGDLFGAAGNLLGQWNANQKKTGN